MTYNDYDNNDKNKKKKKEPPTPAELGLTDAEAAETVELLLDHAYHLPKNGWCQDWYQYMTNNHPVFGICFHHPLHPLPPHLRFMALIGSVLMGLCITCLIYIAFVYSQQDYGYQFLEVSTNVTRTGLQEDLDDSISSLTVTSGNIALWTVGAFLHGVYDNMIWSLAAGACCTCCAKKDQPAQIQPGASKTRTFLVMFSIVVVAAITFFSISLHMALSTDDETEIVLVGNATNNATDDGDGRPGFEPEQLYKIKVDNRNDFEFIIAYLIEMAVSYFISYPLVGTILFSGVLSCGKGKLFGGRPYEIKAKDDIIEEEGFEVSRMEGGGNYSTVVTDSSTANKKNKGTSQTASNPPKKKHPSKKPPTPNGSKFKKVVSKK